MRVLPVKVTFLIKVSSLIDGPTVLPSLVMMLTTPGGDQASLI